MGLEPSHTPSDSPRGPPLDIRCSPSQAAPGGVTISASAGASTVTLCTHDELSSSWIVRSWDELLSLHQELRNYDSREKVETFRDYACLYGATVVHDIDCTPGEHLEIRPFVPLSGHGSPSTVCTWTHIDRISDDSISWVAKRAGLEEAALARYLAAEPGFEIRSSVSLITRTFDLELPQTESDFGKASVTTCTIICGDDFIITVSNEPLAELLRLRDDIKERRIHPRDCCASGDIARSLVEATARQYQRQVEVLSSRIEGFWETHGSQMPSTAEMLIPQVMRKDLELCRRLAHRFDDALGVIDLRDDLAGKATNRILHGIILQTLKEVGQSLSRCEQHIRDGLNTWSSIEERWRNETLSRQTENQLRYIPVALWAAIGGMNFAGPMPDWVWYCGLVASCLYGAMRSRGTTLPPSS